MKKFFIRNGFVLQNDDKTYYYLPYSDFFRLYDEYMFCLQTHEREYCRKELLVNVYELEMKGIFRKVNNLREVEKYKQQLLNPSPN